MPRAAKQHILDSIVDLERPWIVRRPDSGFPAYYSTKTAAEWKALLARAQQGDPEAEFSVGSYYDDGCKDDRGGILVRRSSHKAAEWYRRAAEHGNTGAQVNLSNLLGDGRGVKKDVPDAMRWLRRALRGGYGGGASNNIAMTYRQDGHLRQAVSWLKKSAADGTDAGVGLQLGIHYYWGKGVRADHAKAVRLFRKATKAREVLEISEYERENAFFHLAIAYVEGKGVKKSFAMARKLLERANKDNDHPPAARLLHRLAKDSR